MPKFTASKTFSIMAFLAMMVIFFIWIVQQVGDLGLVFGFRNSHTVANDIANIITSAGGIPGNVEIEYRISPGPNTQRSFTYRVDIRDKSVCVTSWLQSEDSSTSDCASHPYDVDGEQEAEGKCLDVTISKTVDDQGDDKISPSVRGCA